MKTRKRGSRLALPTKTSPLLMYFVGSLPTRCVAKVTSGIICAIDSPTTGVPDCKHNEERVRETGARRCRRLRLQHRRRFNPADEETRISWRRNMGTTRRAHRIWRERSRRRCSRASGGDRSRLQPGFLLPIGMERGFLLGRRQALHHDTALNVVDAATARVYPRAKQVFRAMLGQPTARIVYSSIRVAVRAAGGLSSTQWFAIDAHFVEKYRSDAGPYVEEP